MNAESMRRTNQIVRDDEECESRPEEDEHRPDNMLEWTRLLGRHRETEILSGHASCRDHEQTWDHELHADTGIRARDGGEDEHVVRDERDRQRHGQHQHGNHDRDQSFVSATVLVH